MYYYICLNTVLFMIFHTCYSYTLGLSILQSTFLLLHLHYLFHIFHVKKRHSLFQLTSVLATSRPFRLLDTHGNLKWDKIKSLDKGKIYKQVKNINAI